MGIENVKYFKDLNHNYMIVKRDMKVAQNYQHKMLTANKLKYFLECKIRYINQESHFYYEISSRQNIVGLFGRKAMGHEQLRRLFEGIKEALEELDSYLLDSKCLVLQPEYIFADPETEEYCFLYYPYYMEEGEEDAYMSLAEFLVEKVDHAQEEAAAIAYKVYEMAQDEGFILPKILSLFGEELREESEKTEKHMEQEKIPDIILPEAGDIADCSKQAERETPQHLIAAGILALICIGAAAGIFLLQYFYLLSMEERILSIAGSIVLVIMAAALSLYLILNCYGRNRRWNEERGNGEVGVSADASFPINPYAENIPCGMPAIPSGVKETTNRSNWPEKDMEYGNTVFLETSMCKTEHKLYGMNKGNKYHINLEHLPCTIGKMAGSVDVVIKDSTVSRIHARFTKKGEGIFVTDMNSTNGTFKNGLRLEPNETVIIEQGDELRFGRMTFCYR